MTWPIACLLMVAVFSGNICFCVVTCTAIEHGVVTRLLQVVENIQLRRLPGPHD